MTATCRDISVCHDTGESSRLFLETSSAADPMVRSESAAERDACLAYVQLVRELALDVTPPRPDVNHIVTPS